MSMIDKDTYYMSIAELVSKRSKCLRRQVGVVLVDDCGHIKATGYNGPPKEFPHCKLCPQIGGKDAGDYVCYAIHAELNAMLQCDQLPNARRLYTTTFPCFECAKAIANTNIKDVHYVELSTKGARHRKQIEKLFAIAGIRVHKIGG